MKRFVPAKEKFKICQPSLADVYKNRDKILIVRSVGGLGDILMHRMMFEDFKIAMPSVKITFACPPQYIPAVTDHPFLHEVVDCRTVDASPFIVKYNTSSACGRYEMSIAPLADKNRSDIWAEHCGLMLTKHNMHINLEEEYVEFGKRKLRELSNKPIVLISPVSAMIGKNLLFHQLEGLVKELRKMDLFVCAIHNKSIPDCDRLQVPVISGISIRQWMGVINQADYVISVDSSCFHCAGGMGKPLVGIFTFADGVVYGKYYDFFLVQKHRKDGNWSCGPCYEWSKCPKSMNIQKPCLTELTSEMIVDKAKLMLEKWPLAKN